MLTSGCLCAAIRHEVDALCGPVDHCHCRTCRKAHSAAFATTARAKRSAFRFTRGEEGLRSFESTPGKQRFFCGHCGSHLIAAWDEQPEVIVRIGSIDDSSAVPAPVAHIFTGQKAPWHEITDSLVAFEEAPRARTAERAAARTREEP